MNVLYFYSHNDGEIRSIRLESVEQVVQVINQDFTIKFLDFLRFRTSNIDLNVLRSWQNKIAGVDIQLIIDVLEFQECSIFSGIELNNLLLGNSNIKKYVFKTACRHQLIHKYLQWVFANYIQIFNKFYGEMILIASNDKPITRLPHGFHLIKFKNDSRNFYSAQNLKNTKELCKSCGIKILESNILIFKLKDS